MRTNAANRMSLSAFASVFVAWSMHGIEAWAQPAPATATATPAVAVVPAAPAVAVQPTPNDAEGRAAFDRGMQALGARRFADAVTALREALRLRPTALTVYNLALALRGTGSYVETVELFDRYLASPEEGAVPERLAAIREETANLRRSVARVDLNLTPATATLRVDGRSLRLVPGGLRLDPGAHALDVEADGYVRDHREITLAPGAQMVLAIALRQTVSEGRLIIEPTVPEAVVHVDGRSWGGGRSDRPIAQGPHVIEVRATGYYVWRREVQIVPGVTSRVEAALRVTRSSRGWVLPVAIGGGVALIATAVVLGVVLSSSGSEPSHNASWGNFNLP